MSIRNIYWRRLLQTFLVPLLTLLLTLGFLSPAKAASVPSRPSATVANETITVRTDLFVADISTVGGDLTRLELVRYTSADDKTRPFALFDPKHRYAAQSGLVGEGLPNHQTAFVATKGPRVMSKDGGKDDKLQLRLEAVGTNGVKVAKIYTFIRGSYLIDIAYEIANGSQHPLTAHAYYQFQRDDVAPAGESEMLKTFTGPAIYTGEAKYQKIDFADINKDKANFAKTADNGWLGMVQHYFVAAWVPQGNEKREFYVRKMEGGTGSPLVTATGLILPVAQIAPGAKGYLSITLYAGPQEQVTLKKVADGLDRVVDYGSLTVIAVPILWVLEAIHGLVGNWGWSIVILTVGIKLIFFPLSAASYKSMAKMRNVTPRLKQIKDRYGDDRQSANKEIMALYQAEKINPLGGCLPILVQIPVFIALFWVLLGAVEMRDASWILWITDLSSADPYYVLPVIMAASMIIQARLNPAPPDPIQAKLMMFLPFVLGVMFFWFPSGLVLYWVVNNILSIAQQWQITRVNNPALKGGACKSSD